MTFLAFILGWAGGFVLGSFAANARKTRYVMANENHKRKFLMETMNPSTLRNELLRLLPGTIMWNKECWLYKSRASIFQPCVENDPLLDTNAAAAMQLTLHSNRHEAEAYYQILEGIVYKIKHSGTGIAFQVLDASPAQRFEAFVKMKGGK